MSNDNSRGQVGEASNRGSGNSSRPSELPNLPTLEELGFTRHSSNRVPTGPPIRTTYFMRDGIQPAIFLLHGLCFDSYSWICQAKGLLSNVSNRIIIPDLVGHGFSDKPLELKPYDGSLDPVQQLQGYVRDIELIAQRTGSSQPLILVGWSFGGAIAIQFAATYPNRVIKLVLHDTTPKLATKPGEETSWPHGLPSSLLEGAANDWESGGANGDAATRNFMNLVYTGDNCEAAKISELSDEMARRTIKFYTNPATAPNGEPKNYQPFANITRASINLDLRGRMALIGTGYVPIKVLIIHGNSDMVVRSTVVCAMLDLLTNVPPERKSLTVFSGKAHAPHHTSVGSYNDSVLPFIRGDPTPPAEPEPGCVGPLTEAPCQICNDLLTAAEPTD